MSFERSRAAGVPLTIVASTGSTNADLLATAPATDHLAALATLDQTAGRGRLDRVWTAPPGRTLAVSVLVRADLDPVARGWLPLVAGVAMRDAVAPLVTATAVAVKWPNDVLVDDRKLCGILAQVAADGSVVVGAGVNLTLTEDDLPTPVATSLALAGARGGADDLADVVLAGFWTRFREAVSGLSADLPAVRARVRAACGTIGREVRVELPDGSVLEGTARDLDDEGRLVVEGPGTASTPGAGRASGAVTAIAVGDVTHLRYA
ncbi:biotin--[acetyl-CoA-carboxylase] ligase [Curtobacterium sp. MCBD17_013]|uniref:biotin--[acetyl-CoA-carboxylase] ligase n=1 Tax=Curtobacterium sp. MCBD17_013 TaxID=2175668 RepID=UPI000DA814FB|nr:biotin--[acetyl-CoA-carboxylase] ligase [Curtobacterium sp. MCBD17_013]PZF64427.1 biotin--[acetyl-CoA-carboxylase] ligase [Curtobacterium sp. MCBD17_013]